MAISTINIRQLIAAVTFLAVLFSVNVSVAAEDEKDSKIQAQPYLFATNTASTVVDENETPLTLIHSVFLTAIQSPADHRTAEQSKSTVMREIYVTSTGYNSEVAQTDDSPFITANGEHVYWGGVAANFLPFGTKIRIPDYFGDQIFRVNDRMNKRYWERVDVWFPEKSEAIQWGRRTVRVEILGS